MLQVETIFKHLLTTVGKMFRRVATSFLVTFAGLVVVVEGVAVALAKGQFPPAALTHVVAVVIGFGFGLAVALAVAIEEGLRGFIVLIEEVAKTTERAAVSLGREIGKDGGQLLRAAEHEAGVLAQGAGRVVQSVERGASTAVRDVAHLPGQIISGAENAGHSIEERFTGGGGQQ
ncbi:MAG: hypothetical protein H0X24_11275 [Ktedonobacterales bacterium]|nr:hypothetical protein [Ktedonobacterales bacterium]